MKTTVRTRTFDVVVEPIAESENVRLSFHGDFGLLISVQLTPNQAHALTFGVDQALEVHQVAEQGRAAA